MGKGEIDFDLPANARDAQDLAHRTTRNRGLSKSNFLQGKPLFAFLRIGGSAWLLAKRLNPS